MIAPGGVIAAVAPGSVGDEVGLEPGDRLVAINGHRLHDVIDYRYYAAEEELDLIVERDGQRYGIEIERGYDEELGIEFCRALFDGLRECTNACPFCFVRQMPRARDLGGYPPLRPSLLVRDDDYRSSFLHGTFVTLTNLTEDDWQRIGQQRLSPLYVSIHATDDAVRRWVLGNREAPTILPQLRRLGDLGIEVHGQIVLWPKVNDGPVLGQSVGELLSLWPTVQTLAVVPVGVTRFHRGIVRNLSPAEARAVLEIVDCWAPRVRDVSARTWLYPSDELYLLAGRTVPPSVFYDDAAQRENGVGLVRELLDDWHDARSELCSGSLKGREATLVCGELIAPYLRQIAQDVVERAGASLEVRPVRNRFFGATVTVSGLLTGRDVVDSLASSDMGEMVFVPRRMFDADGTRTLDELSISDIESALGRPVATVEAISEVLTHLRAAR